jgi:hypothetical protein
MTALGVGGGEGSATDAGGAASRSQSSQEPVAARRRPSRWVPTGTEVAIGADSRLPVPAEGQTAAETSAGSEIAVVVPTETQTTAAARTVRPDIDHLKRAWPVVLEAVKKRQAGLSAVLGEGHPESLEGGELVIKFPAGYSFQANQVARGENPRVIAEALREVTGKELRITTKLATEPAPEPAGREEDARILSKDELIRALEREFGAREMDDGPRR